MPGTCCQCWQWTVGQTSDSIAIINCLEAGYSSPRFSRQHATRLRKRLIDSCPKCTDDSVLAVMTRSDGEFTVERGPSPPRSMRRLARRKGHLKTRRRHAMPIPPGAIHDSRTEEVQTQLARFAGLFATGEGPGWSRHRCTPLPLDNAGDIRREKTPFSYQDHRDGFGTGGFIILVGLVAQSIQRTD